MAIELKWAGARQVTAKCVPQLAGMVFQDVDFSFIDFDRYSLAGSKFIRCGFTGARLQNVQVDSRTEFRDCPSVEAAWGGSEVLKRIQEFKEALGTDPEHRPPTLAEQWRAEEAAKAAAAKQ
jgi:hypothetical protein